MTTTNNYVLGRGKVYFDRFVSSSNLVSEKGERYIGNSPTLSITTAADTLDHYSSDAGQKVKDASVDLQVNRSGAFSCDNIEKNNLALFFSGIATAVTQTSATAVVDTVALYKDRSYQIGKTAGNPTGVRNVSNVVVATTGGSPVTLNPSNYDVDLSLGRLYVHAGASITDGTSYTITYDVAAGTRDQVVSKNSTIYGAIHFIADNAAGENKDYYLPYVKLSPNGDYNLKGDDWQVMGFNMEILKLNDITEAIYIDSREV